ncbi:MAG: hypothetical protein ONB42_10970 [candidate division KSB1 bacterium]|nr:hypothetical protein [candidate division KSB1 bacterium]MDZ7310438.1 hypothetical protein [candidate division KSB1 bacterium]
MQNLRTYLCATLFLGLILMAGCNTKEEPTAPEGKEKLSLQKTGMNAAAVTPISIYGVWHAGNDYCTWGTVRDLAEFDSKNHWLIDRGNGLPSVNLVVLSFVHPLKLLNKTTDSQTLNGIPRGMTQEIVNYFKSRNIRVMLSIGGITYTEAWNQALSTNPTQLGLNAAEVAQTMGVGIEIDYEQNSDPNLDGLQAFIDAYRSVLPYDATGNNHAARLTIDLAAGDRWLIALTRKATADWLNTTTPVLDYANAMVPNRQPNSAADAQANWQEHIDGKPQYNPPILPLAPAKFTGGLYIVTGTKPAPECTNFDKSLQKSTGNYVQTVLPNGAGTTPGMLGYMFWAAECPSTRRICTTPPNSCENGVGAGAAYYNIPIPMPALRQQ